MNEDDLASALRGKSRPEQLRLMESITSAGNAGRFPLTAYQTRQLALAARDLRQGLSISENQLPAINTVVRQYEQHLIALTRAE